MISDVPYFVIASSSASTGASAVRLFDNRHDSTRREAQSMTDVLPEFRSSSKLG